MEIQYRGNGKVFYKEKEYLCDLYYNENLGGVVININHMKNMASFLELPVEIKYLSGQLSNGFKFTLYKCIRTNTNDMLSYGKTVYTYEAESLLCGIGGNEQNTPTFYLAEYTLSDIIEWGEITTYQVGDKYELIKHESPEIVIYEAENVKIVYTVRGSMLPLVKTELLAETIELQQHGVVGIEIKDEKTLDDFNVLFRKIKRLIEISSIRKVNIEKMEIYSKDIFDEYGKTIINRPIPVYGVLVKKQKKDRNKSAFRRYSWITLTELMTNDCFRIYFEKYELLEPIIELFLETVYINSSNRRIFLNVVQALETYHSRFITNDLKEYKKRVDSIVKSTSKELEESKRSFLLANSKKFITLESRLADLVLAEHNIYFDTGDIKLYDFPEVIAKTRNYYIHYDNRKKEKVLSEEELGWYNGILFYILEYYILKELGFSEGSKQLREKLNERWGSVSQKLDIIKLSREMDN